MQQVIKGALRQALKKFGLTDVNVQLEHPVQEEHGDYATNIALIAAKHLAAACLSADRARQDVKKPPMEIAESIAQELQKKLSKDIKISIAKPGFINFTLSQSLLLEKTQELLSLDKMFRPVGKRSGQKIMVEYAHPNTHKEMHIGHMRTLITGEAICRLLEATGSQVFRANYQGDIGPHVAKALWGIKKLMQERDLMIDTGNWKLEFEAGKSKAGDQSSNIKLQDQASSIKPQASKNVANWSSKDKAHFLGEGYVRGNKDYEAHKDEIDQLNTSLYLHIAGHSRESENLPVGRQGQILNQVEDDNIGRLYQITRRWSLDYYDNFYQRFYTTFDRLFFESEMVEEGKRIVKENLGKVFVQDNGAIIFSGEKYGLHTRVFITQAGNPTYEGKEMANAYAEYNAFPFDLKIHVVASEQAGYFQVVFKALELIDPEKFENKQHHVSMGMVQLADRKISSRTGDILTVDWLIDQVKERIESMVQEGKIEAEDRDKVTEQVAIGAIKYSVLKVGTGQNVAFDIAKSVSLDGDSGPYLQYTYARIQSVLRKSQVISPKSQVDWKLDIGNFEYPVLVERMKLEIEEISLLRSLYRFDEIVIEAADTLSPHVLAGYLFDLAQKFNLFYQKHKILESEQREFRLALTIAVGNTIKQGLDLLGIQAPEKM